jgi:hypothetical protein
MHEAQAMVQLDLSAPLNLQSLLENVAATRTTQLPPLPSIHCRDMAAKESSCLKKSS